MSAKWRRNRKNLERFNLFKPSNQTKIKKDPSMFRTGSSKSQFRKTRAHGYGIPRLRAGRKLVEPEPLVDILEREDEIVVVAELAGFGKEALRIHLRNQRLILNAKTMDRKYHKSLNLPKRVIPDTMRTTYKNGVLEIQLKKAAEEKTIDKVAG